MKKTVFTGVATALVTPMNSRGVDYDAFGKLIEWQIQEGINALVIAGTSGEGSTLSDAEHKEVLRFSVEKAGGRVPIIAGTGSNDTAYAIELTKFACEVGPLKNGLQSDSRFLCGPCRAPQHCRNQGSVGQYFANCGDCGAHKGQLRYLFR